MILILQFLTILYRLSRLWDLCYELLFFFVCMKWFRVLLVWTFFYYEKGFSWLWSYSRRYSMCHILFYFYNSKKNIRLPPHCNWLTPPTSAKHLPHFPIATQPPWRLDAERSCRLSLLRFTSNRASPPLSCLQRSSPSTLGPFPILRATTKAGQGPIRQADHHCHCHPHHHRSRVELTEPVPIHCPNRLTRKVAEKWPETARKLPKNWVHWNSLKIAGFSPNSIELWMPPGAKFESRTNNKP